MPDIGDIREALADSLTAGISGFQFKPYKLSNATPPCGFVWVGPIQYDQAMHDGAHWMTFMVTVYAALVSDIGSPQVVQSLMNPSGSGSVKAAIETDKTLGGLVASANVTECSGEQVYVAENSGPAIGCDFTVRVLT